MEVSVVIINFNTYNLTCDCIQSVQAQTRDISYEIILVDNNSTEAEQVPFEQKFPQIKVVRLPENGGFAKGNNAGIKQASGEFILLLNSDTILKENSIKKTYDYLKAHPKVGVASSRLVYKNGIHQSVAQRFPSAVYQSIELLRLQKLLSVKKRGRLLLGAFFDHKSTAKVDWVWGAFFMFPSKILAALPEGKLNDRFFMYVEDMQWCKDISRLGYEIHFFAGTEVIHLMGGSSGAKEALMEKNMSDFLRKNYSSFHIFLMKLIKWLYLRTR